MVPKKDFVDLANEFGLELVEWRNFHDFAGHRLGGGGNGIGNGNGSGTASSNGSNDASQHKAARDLWRQTTHGETPENSNMSSDEWEAARLYAAFAFRMSGSGTCCAFPKSGGTLFTDPFVTSTSH